MWPQPLAVALVAAGAAALGFLLTIFLTPWRKAFTMLDSDIKSLFSRGGVRRLQAP